jgi:hypothetical protein
MLAEERDTPARHVAGVGKAHTYTADAGKGYTLFVHNAVGRKRYTPHIHTAGGGKGYTRYVYNAGGGKGKPPHVHTDDN